MLTGNGHTSTRAGVHVQPANLAVGKSWTKPPGQWNSYVTANRAFVEHDTAYLKFAGAP